MNFQRTIGAEIGFLLGVIHHLVCQFPRQRDVTTTLKAYIAANAVYLALAVRTSQSAGINFVVQIIVFNAVWVYTENSRGALIRPF